MSKICPLHGFVETQKAFSMRSPWTKTVVNPRRCIQKVQAVLALLRPLQHLYPLGKKLKEKQEIVLFNNSFKNRVQNQNKGKHLRCTFLLIVPFHCLEGTPKS